MLRGNTHAAVWFSHGVYGRYREPPASDSNCSRCAFHSNRGCEEVPCHTGHFEAVDPKDLTDEERTALVTQELMK